MKMRAINRITGAVIVIVNILAAIAVLTGPHTLFSLIAVAISLAVSLGMYLRVVIGTTALEIAGRQEKLICFAIAQRKSPGVVREFAKWVRNGDMDFKGAKIADLIKARTDDDEFAGFWLLMVGSESTYNRIRREMKDKATVLDYWPVNYDKWADNMLNALEQDEDFEELKEEPNDTESDVSELPGAGS